MRPGFSSSLLVIVFSCAPAPSDPLVIEKGIRREVFLVEGPRPEANPAKGGETPPEASGVNVVRYRVDTGSAKPKAARAIVVLVPGF